MKYIFTPIYFDSYMQVVYKLFITVWLQTHDTYTIIIISHNTYHCIVLMYRLLRVLLYIYIWYCPCKLHHVSDI